jgi:hypothetical protein
MSWIMHRVQEVLSRDKGALEVEATVCAKHERE